MPVGGWQIESRAGKNGKRKKAEAVRRYLVGAGHMDKPTKEKAVGLAKSFLLSGLRVRADDGEQVEKEIQRIVDGSKRLISRAVKEFMSTGDMDSFALSLLPVHYRILYEAYAPYWLKHCKPVSDHDEDAAFTYYNDLIDMYWVGAWGEWKRKGKWEVTIMLPPTKGLVVYSYKQEIREHKKCRECKLHKG